MTTEHTDNPEVAAAIEAYKAAKTARYEAERTEQEAIRHVGAVVASLYGLAVGDTVETARGKRYRIDFFEGSEWAFTYAHGTQITNSGALSKKGTTWIGTVDERLTKAEGQ